jgi:Zn-dependent peptidase ImmA (M78 family)/transcriptional regulator with XRE-family HTH domain
MTKTLDALDPRDLGQRLQLARKARGLTQAQAADGLGVARTTLTAVEAGDRQIKPAELATLAGLYGRTVGELLRRDEPVEPFSVQLRSNLPGGLVEYEDLEPYIFDFQRLCEDYAAIEKLRGAQLTTRYPLPYEINPAKPERSAEDVAMRERHRLGLGDGPIANLRQLLESDVGLRIFYLEVPPRVAAMYAYTQTLGGCIVVNRKHPPERRRQSLAHDYGHFLTDRYRSEVSVVGRYQRVPAQERFAETFGRAFLLPESGLSRRFNDLHRTKGGKITPADLCVLAHFFFVSVHMMTLRLEELDLIPVGTWDRLEQQGFKVREAQSLLGLPPQLETDEELPTRYRYLVAEAYLKGELSEGQLARFLRTDRVGARRMLDTLGVNADVSQEGEVAREAVDLSVPI